MSSFSPQASFTFPVNLPAFSILLPKIEKTRPIFLILPRHRASEISLLITPPWSHKSLAGVTDFEPGLVKWYVDFWLARRLLINGRNEIIDVKDKHQR
jgi:hypothetical protein